MCRTAAKERGGGGEVDSRGGEKEHEGHEKQHGPWYVSLLLLAHPSAPKCALALALRISSTLPPAVSAAAAPMPGPA